MSGAPAAGMRRESRLRAPADFSRVYATGTRVRSGAVVAIGAVQDELPPRVGIACSRRIGGAVARNRAKRRLREAIRPHLGAIRAGTRLVLEATPAAVTVNYQELEADVREALVRVGALDA